MPAPHPIAVRERVMALVRDGWSTPRIVEALQVGEASIRRWKRALRERGSVAPLPYAGGTTRKLDEPALEVLLNFIEQKPDATLQEMLDVLAERAGVTVDDSTVARAVTRLGYSRKKKTYRLSEVDSERLVEMQADFMAFARNTPPEEFVFLDECGANHAMTPRYARAPEGERAIAPRPAHRGEKCDHHRHDDE